MASSYFIDRVVEHPGRVRMTPVSGQANTYDLDRDEGTVTRAGTPFNAETFNGIADDIISLTKSYHGVSTSAASATTKTVGNLDPGFVLTQGVVVAVEMQEANTVSGTTKLDVDGTGAHNIIALGSGGRTGTITWRAWDTVLFMYADGDWIALAGAYTPPVRISGTKGSAPSSGQCTGWYDPMTGKVSLTWGFTATANIGLDDTLFTIPSAYRPSSDMAGICIVGTAAGTIGSGGSRITSGGIIQQRITSQARSGYGAFEYYV